MDNLSANDGKSIPKRFLDCVEWARLNFEENFSIKQENFALDEDCDQLQPTRLEFENSLHLELNDRDEIVKLITETEQRKISGEYYLPEEIWNLIFTNLGASDLKNVSLVCKRFHEEIANSMELMKKFEIRLTDKSDQETFCQVIANSNRRYRNLSMQSIDLEHKAYKPTQSHFDIFFLEFLRKNPIREIRFYGATMYSEVTFVQICNAVQETLEKFTIHGFPVEESGADDYNVLKTLANGLKWKKLKFVSIGGSWDDILFKYLPNNIEVLKCDDAYLQCDGYYQDPEEYFLDPGLTEFINQQTNLKQIINKWGGLEGKFEIKLEKLDCRYMRFDDIGILLQNQYECLEELSIKGGGWKEHKIKYEEFEIVINKMKKLEKLTLDFCEFPEVEIPIKIFCPTLIELKCSSVHFGKNTLESLLKGFPNLEKLQFEGTAAVMIPENSSKFNKKLKIMKLDTYRWDWETRDKIERTSNSMQNLVEVEFYCCERRSIFVDFFEGCPNVTKITIKGDINQDDFNAILTQASNLKFLHIHNGSELPSNILELNEHLLNNLDVLRISRIRWLTEKSELMLAKHPTLRSYIDYYVEERYYYGSEW